MRELDALLMNFADRHYAKALDDERAGFVALLSLPDPEILGLLTQRLRSEDPRIDRVVRRILGESVPGAR
jgi:succinate dehydrogenase flavin-adding protein (antitoxin of CptAB toxin-antitoxin module)